MDSVVEFSGRVRKERSKLLNLPRLLIEVRAFTNASKALERVSLNSLINLDYFC